jgi:hypothetical protein
MFAELDMNNASWSVKQFLELPNGELPDLDEIEPAFTGMVRDISADNDETISMAAQDVRTFFNVKLPPRVYNDISNPGLEAGRSGDRRPLWFGAKENISPVRIDASSDEFGVYELADTSDAPNGIKSIDAIYSYEDATAARLQDTASRILLVSGTHYTEDLANGQFTIDKDVQVIRIDVENKEIDFNDGSDQAATLDEGLYTPASLATEVASKMNAQSTDTITCTYSETTHLFTIASDGGTFQLLAKTGASKDRSAYRTLKYKTDSDKTGATSYAGDDGEVFDAPDSDHILRVDGVGFKDDASGTFTGSANAAINLGPDIARTLIVNYLKKDSSVITQSFTDARTTGRGSIALAVYLKDTTSLKAVFEALERSNLADIVIDGNGDVHYTVQTATVPTGVTDIEDRDYLTWGAKKRIVDVFGEVRVNYDEDPTTGKPLVRSSTKAATKVRFGRQEGRSFETYIKAKNDASLVLSDLATLAATPSLVVSFGVKGKLLQHKIGDKIRLSRNRAPTSTGSLSQVLFRIISIAHDFGDGKSNAECVEV